MSSTFSVWFCKDGEYIGRVGGLPTLGHANLAATTGRSPHAGAGWFNIDGQYDRTVVCRDGLAIDGSLMAEVVVTDQESGEEVIDLLYRPDLHALADNS